MAKKTAIEQQTELLHQMAAALSDAATEQMPGWDELYYDVRYDSSDCGLARTIVRRGEEREQIKTPGEIGECRVRLRSLRKKLLDGYWYGLFIYVNSQGAVDVKFNNDANCIDTFSEDEKNHRPF